MDSLKTKSGGKTFGCTWSSSRPGGSPWGPLARHRGAHLKTLTRGRSSFLLAAAPTLAHGIDCTRAFISVAGLTEKAKGNGSSSHCLGLCVCGARVSCGATSSQPRPIYLSASPCIHDLDIT